MAIESAFSTTEPAVLASYDERVAELEAFNTAVKAVGAQFDREPRAYATVFGRNFAGLVATQEDRRPGAVLPKGLRIDKKSGPVLLVPARRTERGKQFDAEWRKLSISSPAVLGMPSMVEVEDGFQSYMYSPGFTVVDGVLWASWGTSADRVRGEVGSRSTRESEFDSTLWTQRRLSEFFAMREALADTG